MLVIEVNITESSLHTEGFLTLAFMINSSFCHGTVGMLRNSRYSFDSWSILNFSSENEETKK